MPLLRTVAFVVHFCKAEHTHSLIFRGVWKKLT